MSRFYGCGLVCPPLLEGCRILDLGSGSGRDVYVLAQLVGERGHVVGVDMTGEQLAVAERHRAYHSEVFGFDNVMFKQGYIERLDEPGLEPNSFDVIVSNCAVNLSPDKDAVLREVQRLLKPGGEFYFSDVYADWRVPDHVRNDPVMYGECLGGALYWNDFYASRIGRVLPTRVWSLTNCWTLPIPSSRFVQAASAFIQRPMLNRLTDSLIDAVVPTASGDAYNPDLAIHRQDFHLKKWKIQSNQVKQPH